MTPDKIVESALAGRARITLTSARTGVRYSYVIERGTKGDSPPWFVRLSSCGGSWRGGFLGTVFADGAYRHGNTSGIARGEEAAIAFSWAWRHLLEGRLPPHCKVVVEAAPERSPRKLSYGQAERLVLYNPFRPSGADRHAND